MTRVRRVAALGAVATAIAATVGRTSVAEDGRALAPVRIVVVARGCRAEPVDVTALAAALRVELVEEGVSAVDVAAPGSPSPEDPSVATVRLLPVSCASPGGAPAFEISSGATGRSVRSALALDDLDRGIRARVAALVIAERVRASWTELASAAGIREDTAGHEGARAANGAAPADSGGARAVPARPPAPSPTFAPSPPERVEMPPTTEADTTHSPRRQDPPGSALAPHPPALGAAIEGRAYFAPTTPVLGPRAILVLPGLVPFPFRIQFDAGVGWGTARDALGDVSLTFAAASAALGLVAGRGALHVEVGPKAELGWTWVQGVPRSPDVRGSTASAPVGGLSLLASLFADVAAHWMTLAAIDVGVAFSGLEARADERAVAATAGPMVGARAGLVYAF